MNCAVGFLVAPPMALDFAWMGPAGALCVLDLLRIVHVSFSGMPRLQVLLGFEGGVVLQLWLHVGTVRFRLVEGSRCMTWLSLIGKKVDYPATRWATPGWPSVFIEILDCRFKAHERKDMDYHESRLGVAPGESWSFRRLVINFSSSRATTIYMNCRG